VISASSRLRSLAVVAVAVLVLATAAVVAARQLGRWLVVADPMERVPVAVVMAGDTPFRAVEAARLHAEGWTPEIWLTHAAVPAREAALARYGVRYVTDDVYSRAVLDHLGVPAAAIALVPGRVDTTQAELAAIAREMRRRGLDRAAIVTSPSHTRRVRATWSLVAGQGLRAIVRPARESRHDLDHWWRRKSDAKTVTREWIGIVNAWAGFPLRGDLE
jgi:uncharacterized SAM-binding protein YcdF (DUF218 family)